MATIAWTTMVEFSDSTLHDIPAGSSSSSQLGNITPTTNTIANDNTDDATLHDGHGAGLPTNDDDAGNAPTDDANDDANDANNGNGDAPNADDDNTIASSSSTIPSPLSSNDDLPTTSIDLPMTNDDAAFNKHSMITRSKAVLFQHGPIGYDIGAFIGNLIIAFFAQDGHAVAQGNDRKKFIALWDENKNGSREAYLPIIYDNPELQKRIVGVAHVEDF
ncbi:hypothetical protein V6N12_000862 [Hibiscus sabdariffa]|uniref:Uncharacterized protein n=1 Tax=Hibiscus sabdariffa TaxID=183260 RepID=A0ABR2BXH0_9ROSI